MAMIAHCFAMQGQAGRYYFWRYSSVYIVYGLHYGISICTLAISIIRKLLLF